MIGEHAWVWAVREDRLAPPLLEYCTLDWTRSRRRGCMRHREHPRCLAACGPAISTMNGSPGT